MAQCSSDTALRDIHELLACGLLRKLGGGGRSTAYELTTSDESVRALSSGASSPDEDMNKKSR